MTSTKLAAATWEDPVREALNFRSESWVGFCWMKSDIFWPNTADCGIIWQRMAGS